MFSKLKGLLKKKSSLPKMSPEIANGADSPISKKKIEQEQTSHESVKRLKRKPKHHQRRTKQGLPVFENDAEFEKLFGVTDSFEPPETKPGIEKERSSSPEHQEKAKTPRLNKHGFPIMDSREDLEAALLRADRNIPEHPPRKKPQAAAPNLKKREDEARNKHGIRILTDDDLPFDKGNNDHPEPQFEDLLYRSLGSKTMDVLMHEKKEAEKKRKKPTVKQLLKAYPAPQGQLDLHGYTALKADLKVESYLTNAFHHQTHTVNIIVGKGLHSEGGAVLPDVVEQKLKKMKKEGLVLSYDWDNKRKSRSGAVIVYLNNWPYT